MDLERHTEWYALRDRATLALHEGDWIVRLAVLPSFENSHAIGIGPFDHRHVEGRKLRSRTDMQVRWRRWRSDEDYEKFRTPLERIRHPRPLEPTITEQIETIERQHVDSLLSELSTISVPALPRAPIGVDGVSYELHARTGFTECSYRWWNEGPQEWRPLVNWFTATWGKLADHLKAPHDVWPSRLQELLKEVRTAQ